MIRVLALTVLLPALAMAVRTPDPVPRLVDRALDTASYVEMARQWREHMNEAGESVEGLVNLGLALDYAREDAAALAAARRAVEIGPDDPRALSFLGRMLLTSTDEEDEALDVLTRARALDPDDREAIVLLATTHVRRGALDAADPLFRTLLERGHYARPLLDFAHNLLVDLPDGAVLITNGDNDTMPAWALQAGRGFRRDVTVVNRSFLDVPRYVDGVFARRPELVVDVSDDVEDDRSRAVIEALVAADRVPVFVAASAMVERRGWAPSGPIEGIIARLSGTPRTSDAVARSMLLRYRMDSATDWTYPWAMHPAHASLMRNYASAIAHVVRDEGLAPDLRDALVAEAEALVDFHDFARVGAYLAAIKARWARD